MTLLPHARPGLSVEERAARVELACAQADRAEDRRRIIAEAIAAAIHQSYRERLSLALNARVAEDDAP